MGTKSSSLADGSAILDVPLPGVYCSQDRPRSVGPLATEAASGQQQRPESQVVRFPVDVAGAGAGNVVFTNNQARLEPSAIPSHADGKVPWAPMGSPGLNQTPPAARGREVISLSPARQSFFVLR